MFNLIFKIYASKDERTALTYLVITKKLKLLINVTKQRVAFLCGQSCICFLSFNNSINLITSMKPDIMHKSPFSFVPQTLSRQRV